MYALYPMFQAVYSSWERLKARGDEFLPFFGVKFFFGGGVLMYLTSSMHSTDLPLRFDRCPDQQSMTIAGQEVAKLVGVKSWWLLYGQALGVLPVAHFPVDHPVKETCNG